MPTQDAEDNSGADDASGIDNIHDSVLKELVQQTDKKKRKKKKKAKKSKLRRSRSKVDDTYSEGESDSFEENFQNAVLDTNLDKVADRQLRELSKMQSELNELRNSDHDDNNDDAANSQEDEHDEQYKRQQQEGDKHERKDEHEREDEEEQPFLPASNQEAQYRKDPDPNTVKNIIQP